MFCPEGYITLLEVRELLRTHARKQMPELERAGSAYGPNAYNEVDAYSDWLLLSFLIVHSDKIRIAIPTGSVVRVSPYSFHPEPAFETVFFDLDGDIESGVAPDEWDAMTKIYRSFPEDRIGRLKASDYAINNVELSTLTFRCGTHFRTATRAEEAVNGLPLCIQEDFLPATVDQLVARVEAAVGRLWTPSEVVSHEPQPVPLHKQIVDALREGTISKKAEARQQFGRGMKTEAFRALWKQVAQEVPEASKPGPRPRHGDR